MEPASSNLITLSFGDLVACLLLIACLALATRIMRLGITVQLMISACRTVAQLLMIGMVLKLVFSNVSILYTGLITMFMLVAASFEIVSRQTRRIYRRKGLLASGFSMFISSFLITISALLLIIKADPWYSPQYAIPLLGMLLGNTMNGISLGMDRLVQSAWQKRDIIEQKLMLGYDRKSAIEEIRSESIKAAMIPSINSMAAAGIVSLPGMMTGQILAGSPPMEAVKYQIFIMFLIVSGTGFGVMAAIGIISKMMFDSRDRLRLNNLIAK